MYYLGTCNTCRRVLDALAPLDGIALQDIREEVLDEGQLDELRDLAGSYEALFSKRARLYRERGLQYKALTEADYRNLILEHYTFLNRPVIVSGNSIFIGSGKKTVASARENLHP